MISSTPRVRVTWDDLVAIEPRLNDLLAEARSLTAEAGGFFCRDFYYTGFNGHLPFKDRIINLVGWKSAHPGTIVATSEAYKLTIDTILNAMPSCRKCGCLDFYGNWID